MSRPRARLVAFVSLLMLSATASSVALAEEATAPQPGVAAEPAATPEVATPEAAPAPPAPAPEAAPVPPPPPPEFQPCPCYAHHAEGSPCPCPCHGQETGPGGHGHGGHGPGGYGAGGPGPCAGEGPRRACHGHAEGHGDCDCDCGGDCDCDCDCSGECGCGGFFAGLTETDHPFSLTRGRVELGVMGLVQLLGVPYIQDPAASLEAGSLANVEGFRLRRARIGVEGTLPYHFGFELLIGLAGEGTNVLDANLSWEPHPLARLRAGAMKVPFSGVMLLGAGYQMFLDRPYIVRTVAPDRALGFEISGRHPWFTYHAGIFNGGGDYYTGDNNTGMLYAARFALHPLGALPDGEITQPERLLFQVAGSYFFNQDAAGNRHGVSAELALRWQRVTFRGEFLWSTFGPIGEPAIDEGVEYGHTTWMGFFAEAGVFVINDYLLVGFRGEGQRLMEPGTEIQDSNDLWAIAPVVSGYFLQGRIKLSIQYEHRHEWFEDQVDNDVLALQLQGRI